MNDMPKTMYEFISCDAELTAMRAIPPLLKDLSKDRKMAVLEYMFKRYESGDNFGLD